MELGEVNDYILIGGTTRIPKVRELLKGMFGGREPNQTINPDEAIGFGAAIYSHWLSNGRGMRVHANITKSLWVEALRGCIANNHRNTKSDSLSMDRQIVKVEKRSVIRGWVEGCYNYLLPKRKQESTKSKRAQLQEDSKIRTTRKTLGLQNSETALIFASDRNGLVQFKDEVSRMSEECEREKQRNAAKISLEMYVYDIGDQVKVFNAAETLTEQHHMLYSTFLDAKKILASNSFPETYEYVEMKIELEQVYDRVVALEADRVAALEADRVAALEAELYEKCSRESTPDPEEDISLNNETNGGIINGLRSLFGFSSP